MKKNRGTVSLVVFYWLMIVAGAIAIAWGISNAIDGGSFSSTLTFIVGGAAIIYISAQYLRDGQGT
jgi:hypothetical protein